MASADPFAIFNMTKMYPGIPPRELDDFLRDKFQGRETYRALSEIEQKILYGSVHRELQRMYFEWLLANLPTFSPSKEDYQAAQTVCQIHTGRTSINQELAIGNLGVPPRFIPMAKSIHDCALLFGCTGLAFNRYLNSADFAANAPENQRNLWNAMKSMRNQSDPEERTFTDADYLMESQFRVLLIRSCGQYELEVGRPINPDEFEVVLHAANNQLLKLAAGTRFGIEVFDYYFSFGKIPVGDEKPVRFIYGQNGALQNIEFHQPNWPETLQAMRDLPQSMSILWKHLMDNMCTPASIGCPALRSTVSSHGNIISFFFSKFNEAARNGLFSPERQPSVSAQCPYDHSNVQSGRAPRLVGRLLRRTHDG